MRTTCLVFVLVFGFISPGCGTSDDKGDALPVPMCGMACVGNGLADLQIESMDEATCQQVFDQYEASHPNETCGYAWMEVPRSGCITSIVKVYIYLILCAMECVTSPDPVDCILVCLQKYVQVEGNCIACAVENLLDFYMCVDKNPLTSEDVDTCVAAFIGDSSTCQP